MKNKRLITIVGIVCLVICVIIVGFLVFNKKTSTTNPTSSFENLSLEEIKKLQEEEEKFAEKVAEKTNTKEKVMNLFDEGEKIMGNTDECEHLWDVDSEYTNAHNGEELKFKCQNCKKEVTIDAITYDVWWNITVEGEDNSFYLKDLEESEPSATVTFENETSETNE